MFDAFLKTFQGPFVTRFDDANGIIIAFGIRHGQPTGFHAIGIAHGQPTSFIAIGTAGTTGAAAAATMLLESSEEDAALESSQCMCLVLSALVQVSRQNAT